jgi:UDP-3-O-[3-hydroxymyristoyl] glucosamine N-acyltransferase
MKFSEIVQKLDPTAPTSLTQNPTCNPDIGGVMVLDRATAGTMSYIEGDRFAAQVYETGASGLILPPDTALQALATQRDIAWISSHQGRLLFAKAIALFYQPFRPAPEIHPTAVIHPSVKLGDDVAIGAHVVIQPGVTIGHQVCIHPNVVIYPGVVVGDRTILHANCTIHERTQVGANCVIHSGAVVGSEGFGFVPIPEGWFKMEQSGWVVLEDGVEVGCNSTIDRPAVGETRVKRNTKLDNMVHIAHGCLVGENCAMAAQVGIAGSATIGNRVILGGKVGVADHVLIGDGVIAAAKAGLHGNIDPGMVVSGMPAIPRRLWLKAATLYARLPEIYQTLKQLQRRVEKLEQ